MGSHLTETDTSCLRSSAKKAKNDSTSTDNMNDYEVPLSTGGKHRLAVAIRQFTLPSYNHRHPCIIGKDSLYSIDLLS